MFNVSMCVLAITSCIPHHPINADKIFGLLGPDRKLHITHRDAVVTHAKLVLVAVDEHLGQVVELWDQLLVAERADAGAPFSSDMTTEMRVFTLTSAVSRWQFLQERPMPEKALSGLSNLLSLALRKNVEKGSCRGRRGILEKNGSRKLGAWKLPKQEPTILSIHMSVE